MKRLTVNSIATKLAISIPTLFALVYFGNMLGAKVNDKIGIMALVVSFITIGIGSTIVQLVKTDMAVSIVTGMTFGAILFTTTLYCRYFLTQNIQHLLKFFTRKPPFVASRN